MEEIFKAYNELMIALEKQGKSCEHICILMHIVGDKIMEIDNG